MKENFTFEEQQLMGGNGVRAVGGSTSMNKRNSVK